MKTPRILGWLVLSLTLTLPWFCLADSATLLQDQLTTSKARVEAILEQSQKTVPGTDTISPYQRLRVQILDGAEAGQTVEIKNDFLNLKVGELFYLQEMVRGDTGEKIYSVSEPYRLNALIGLTILLIAVVIIFGGWPGLRGLASLIGSLFLIAGVLLPSILHGYPPILVTIGVASLIIIVGSYITHGFNKTTSAAVLGMIVTVIITGAFAYWSVKLTHLSGFSSEETVYLNLNSRGSIDLLGLLFGGIMIGLLGVLYDIAIGQAIAVEELHQLAPHIPKKKIYQRATRIGREHIGALVNTLAIAYVGASLPLLLLFYGAKEESLAMIANRELFATEIVRTIIGSLGLVLAVPITTSLAALMLVKNKSTTAGEILKKEEEELEHFHHHH
jgi:uncharacterized membrane protein